MNKFRNITYTIRVVTGVIILLHGLLRIIYLDTYIEFVLTHFYDMLPTETGLTVGASLFPFIEFFTGLLIISNVNIKKSIRIAFCISLVMICFIIADQLYSRLIYHGVIIGLLVFLCFKVDKNQQTPTLSV